MYRSHWIKTSLHFSTSNRHLRHPEALKMIYINWVIINCDPRNRHPRNVKQNINTFCWTKCVWKCDQLQTTIFCSWFAVLIVVSSSSEGAIWQFYYMHLCPAIYHAVLLRRKTHRYSVSCDKTLHLPVMWVVIVMDVPRVIRGEINSYIIIRVLFRSIL